MLVLALVGCGDDQSAEGGGPNAADARFAQAVVQHHAQTLQLIQMPQTLQMPTRRVTWIETARTERLSEIEDLSDLLHDWGQQVPSTGLEHADEGDQPEFDASIDGVLTGDEVSQVRRAKGDLFVHAWFQALIDHERGALALAAAQIETGEDPSAIDFARADVKRHTKVIEKLQELAPAE